MPSLDGVVRRHTDLGDDDREWLHLLVAEWQMLADLSFADLVLWVPDRDGTGFWACAQMRPTTGPTAHVKDLVETFARRGEKPLLDAAFESGQIRGEGDPELREVVPSRAEAIPVRRSGRVIGVILRNTNVVSVRTPSPLERTYVRTAAALADMICAGRFPFPGQPADLDSAPRVGDGMIRLDDSGVVSYASPNAQSAYRRLGLTGDLLGRNLGATTAALAQPRRRAVDESVVTTLSGRSPRDTEIENPTATLSVRVIPLMPRGKSAGALVLVRDVTDLRRRERELVIKAATIREIHHRVKNNLQTVAALLRLQARRLSSGGAREALEDSVRRVGTIAIVHETLSHGVDEQVDFDEVADRVRVMVVEMAMPSDGHPEKDQSARVTTERVGSFGMLDAETATPLAMVITEVVQNALQHGISGAEGLVRLIAERDAGRLRVIVDDNGDGLPEGFDPRGSGRLGLQIVRTLVETELGGKFSMGPRPERRGTRVILDIPESRRA
ncbi:MAG TPA: histidine kinase N-terminal domain-containing protein [Actinopolymorphaceae bacterium]